MSRLVTLISNKNPFAVTVQGYCANHRCPPKQFMCETCMMYFHNKENLRDFLDDLVQIKH